MLAVTAPAPINGDRLREELAAGGLILEREDVVLVPGDPAMLELHGLDDDARPTVEAVVAAHDPEVARSDGYTIPADGSTSLVVTWQRRGAAGTDVPYDVNGATGNARADADGVVELAVTAATPGPVQVRVGTLEVMLTAEEV